MTREEAIKWLIKPVRTSTDIGEIKAKEFEAYDMAIEALKAPTESTNTPTDTPTDLISRQNAIKVIRSTVAQYVPFLNGVNETLPIECEIALRSVPSAETKTGKWEWSDEDASWKCGCCDFVFEEFDWKPVYNYCPNCGAKMKGGDDDNA